MDIISDSPSTESMISVNIPEPMAGFIQHFETRCTSGCCGIGAFSFSANHAKAWIARHGQDEARLALWQLGDTRRVFELYEFDRLLFNPPRDEFCGPHKIPELINKAEACLSRVIGPCE